MTQLSTIEIPKTFDEAWQDHNWKNATMEEMSTLERNGTWKVV